ncbi:MAG: FKBP-type peptidyl-prolyl cis-trans isomerase N-terminal domain-containing protein [Thiohalomonadales bacterium]
MAIKNCSSKLIDFNIKHPLSARLMLAAVIFSLSLTTVFAAELKTTKEKFSYTIGHNIGQGFKREGISIDSKILMEAINDVLKDKKPRMSSQEMQKAIQEFQKLTVAKREEKGKQAKKAGDAFLAANKSKKGVKTLPSGVQYKVITAAKPNAKKPKVSDTIVAHYKGTLINGTVFDSSYQRNQPATFGVTKVIKGWQEILPMMSIGSKWQVFIPSELAYGSHGQGATIGPGEALIFDIELIEIK